MLKASAANFGRFVEVIRMAIRKTAKTRTRGKATPSAQSVRSNRKPNDYRRNRSQSGYDELWAEFIEQVEAELAAASILPDGLGKSPYYSPPNVVKRAVYRFVRHARKKLKPGPLEATIDKSRVAKAKGKILRTLKKDIRKEPYFWVLTGLFLDCPAANLRKPDVTRFAQQLNYAHRHKVPDEYLVGFLLQTGSLAEVYRRAKDPNHREQWFVEQANS